MPDTPTIGFGLPTITYGSVTGVITSAFNAKVETDKYEAKDENGNVKLRIYRNHRVTGTIEAYWPRGSAVPLCGSTVTVTGLTVPTVTAAGVCSGNFALDTDAASPTTTKVEVISAATLTPDNAEFDKISFDFEYDLVNGLPSQS